MAQDFVSSPPTRSPVDETDAEGRGLRVTREWSSWFTAVFNVVFAVTQSGTTAQRPTALLWVGRPYFDTTLGKPIWYDANGSTGWCLATGVAA